MFRYPKGIFVPLCSLFLPYFLPLDITTDWLSITAGRFAFIEFYLNGNMQYTSPCSCPSLQSLPWDFDPRQCCVPPAQGIRAGFPVKPPGEGSSPGRNSRPALPLRERRPLMLSSPWLPGPSRLTPGLPLPSRGSTGPFSPGLAAAGMVLFQGRLVEELGVGVSAGGATLVRVQG